MRPPPTPTTARPAGRAHRLFDAPPVALPPVLDALAERWWRATPRLRLAVVAVLGLLLLLAIGLMARSPGAQVEVLVAARELHPGGGVSSGDVRTTHRPAAHLPDGAVHEVRGRIVTATVPRGAVITDRHLGAGIGAALPDDRVAVAVDAQLVPSLETGARLELITADHQGQGALLTREASVIGRDDEVVWLSIPPDHAVDVGAAAAGGRLTVAVKPF